MPLVRIEIIKGQPEEYKSKLFDVITEALDISLSVPAEKLTQRLYEIDKKNISTPPGKTDKFTLIEISMFPGRDEVLKKSAIVEITRLMGDKLSIPANDVYIVLSELPKDNWGSGGLTANEFAK